MTKPRPVNALSAPRPDARLKGLSVETLLGMANRPRNEGKPVDEILSANSIAFDGFSNTPTTSSDGVSLKTTRMQPPSFA